MIVSPSNSNKISARPNMRNRPDVAKTGRPSKKRNNFNRSMVSSSDSLQNFSTSNVKKYLNNKAKVNPMTAIENDVNDVKRILEKARALRGQSDGANDETSRLVFLNKENLILREELKIMNNNLNKFIDVLKEHKGKKSIKQKFESKLNTKEDKLKAKVAEKKNYQQMIENMTLEYDKLKKRLDVVGNPNYS